MPGFDWDDFSQLLVEGLAKYNGAWGGIPFDIPIMALMYRKDILDKHGIAPPSTVDEFTAAVKMITAAEKGNGIYGTGLQAKSGHYSLNCDWTQVVWNEGGSIFGSDGLFSGNDELVSAVSRSIRNGSRTHCRSRPTRPGWPVADGRVRSDRAVPQLG